MDKYDLVSIITASYNMGHYLPVAIESALNQTYNQIEIIVVDDGSTDNTKEIIKQFENEPRVRYVFQQNMGQAKAKNRGIKEAKGYYIAFLDADDMWSKDKLEKQLPYFIKNKRIGVVYSDVVYMDEQGNLLTQQSDKTYFSGQITKQLFIDNFINFSSAIVKRECLENLGSFNESLPMSIDWDLWLRISTKYDFVYVNEPLLIYRQWSGQMSHNFEKRFKCILDIMENFSRENKELLTSKIIKKAWAHTYTERAWKSRVIEKERIKAFRFLIRAVKSDPLFLPAWKEIIKVGILYN